MVSCREPQQAGAQQRPARQIERRAGLLARPAAGASASALGRGQRARSSTAAGSGSGRGDAPAPGAPSRRGKVVRSASCRRTISAKRRAQGRRRRARPRSRSAARDVVGGAARLELVEEPQPLLREGERQRRPSRGTGASGGAGGAAAPRRRRDPRGERRRRSAPRTASRSGSSTPKASRTPRQHLRREQRVAAQLEEVVVGRPTRSTPSTSAQIAGEQLLGRVRGRRRSRVARRRALSGARQRLRSTLPLGVSGSASSEHEGRGHHVLRQPLAQEARAARPRPAAGSVGRHDVGDQALVARARPRAPAPPPRAPPGAAASAASISPSSMRKPRTFTWWSSAAEELERRRPAASAPGRRCGRAARPAPARTGRARSAPPSAPAGRR